MRILALLLLLAGPVAAAPVLTDNQADLRGRLDHAFLEAGINFQASAVASAKDPGAIGIKNVPLLIISGNGVGRTSVYQIQTRLGVLDDARTAGYKTVMFFNMIDASKYVFDVSKPGQVCARDLCF